MSNSFENIHYDAFISYRHRPIDEFVAKNLQFLLETYTVPQSAKDMVQKERISRIFRDQDELPLSDNLGTSIEHALKNSEYLIVVCSPTYRESKWCMKEIETFISLHGYGKIIVVLCEGSTNESFPPQLLSAEVEPFASDVRGNNQNEIMKKLKVEYIRVAASLLGVPYDTLRQREQERILQRKADRMKKMAIITSTVALLSLTAVITIGVQKWKLTNNQIDTLLTKIDDDYSVGNTNAALEGIEEVSKLSRRRFGKYDGKLTAKLAKILGVYENESRYVSNDTVQMSDEIVSVKFSNDGKHLLLADNAGNVRVVKTDDFGQVDFETSEAIRGVDAGLSAGFLDNDRIFYIGPNNRLMIATLGQSNIVTKNAILISENNRTAVTSPAGYYIGMSVDTEVLVWSTGIAGEIYDLNLTEGEYKRISFGKYTTFLNDKTFLYVKDDIKANTQEEADSTQEETVCVVNLDTRDVKTYNTGVSKLIYASLIDNRLYLCYQELSSDNGIPAIMLRCINYDNNEECYQINLGNSGVDAIHETSDGYVLLASGSVIMELDSLTGELIDIYNLSDAHLLSFEDCKDGSVKLFTSLGQEINLDVNADGISVLGYSEMMDSASLKYVVKAPNSDAFYAIPTLDSTILNRYELSEVSSSEPYSGPVVDLLFADAKTSDLTYSDLVASYGNPHAQFRYADKKYIVYSFENGRLITVNTAETYVIDEVMLDAPVSVEAGNDAMGNSYFTQQSDSNTPGAGVGIAKDGTIISTFENFAGISEDGKNVILNTHMPSTGANELRAYHIYTYDELLDKTVGK